MEYGAIVYDVPLTRRSVYNKLRTRLGRLSIQMTWSVYLTPFENRDVVLDILREIDEDAETNHRIMYKFLKFDASEKEQLDALVKQRFEEHLKKTKDTLHQKLGEAEIAFGDEQIDVNDWALLRRGACTKAKKKLNEARRLALVFEVTNVMEAAFGTLDALIEAKRDAVKEALKEEKEKAKAEAKAAKEKAKAEKKAEEAAEAQAG
jgi:hypothetical protein